MRWQKKQGLTLVITGVLMGAAVYGTDAWKSRQLLARICAKPIEESAGTWEEWAREEPMIQSKSLSGIVLFCTHPDIETSRVLPADMPKNLKVVCLYPDSLSLRAINQWRGVQRKTWPSEWHRQCRLYENLERIRLSTALQSRGKQKAKDVHAALLPMDLLTNGQTQAYRNSLAGLLLAEFAQKCISEEESSWLLVYEGMLNQEIREKFTKNSRIRYKEWGDE